MGKAGQVIDSFDYSLKLNGQERNYRGMTYQGIYFGGSEELKLNLPNKTIDTIDAIVLDSGVELGAFGGVNTQTIAVNANAEDTPYILLAFDNSIAEEEIRGACLLRGRAKTIRAASTG